MLLGKRPRPPMKRTTSMTEITFDLGETPASQPSDHHKSNAFNGTTTNQQKQGGGGGLEGLDQPFLSTVSPRNNHRRHSADFRDTAHFLRACHLCKRKLVPGRDIYMYRGDSAFCSLECRQQQMNQDEKKNNCSMASNKKAAAAAAAPSPATKGETVAAAAAV